MEFRFNMHPLFRARIVRINNSLLPTGFVAQSRRVALDATAQISEIINTIGSMSAQAQGLSVPVTTAQKLRNSDHHIYLMFESNDRNGLVVGILKVGRKSLYVFDPSGETVNVTAPCVLDFYVHESRQRGGLGRELFEHMLREENIQPDELAIDRPSEKLLGFLQKHYGLSKKIPQMNNFVVYEGFFASKAQNSTDIDGRRMHITASPNTNLFGPTFTTTEERRRSTSQTRTNVAPMPIIAQPPVGRYAAKRPTCSMAQVNHYSSMVGKISFPEENTGNGKRSVFEEQELDQRLADEMERCVELGAGGDEPDASRYTPHHGLEVKFADQPETLPYDDMPEPGPDPDPYDFHPHHLELHDDTEGGGSHRDQSLSPQSVSQQASPVHPAGSDYGVLGSRKPARYTKQNTGLKNISFGVGAAVMPSGKMEFDQEENEGFGSVKINRPIGKSGTRGSLHDDNESVHSNGSQQGGGGHFDLKFYHNKLW
ncbi:AGAP005828-PA [Anopheles gambiae str. PEST]|uniref:Alpha-tubulin N-acetyltransferase n=1 Tax=Anopheles gambiae TaxID=7165 RepID=ATAT_ANOGA|nr:RecName: Full=Alpha-tubulin N-acetyltransferase; Short=Alpha-TAT; Short=TAT; AltName: Full=Acetyltransferase mec-17 homolog [Anopheles gambiae]EAA11927.5 AGAP005828-PA [Anopheles gambiae str. PEST]